MEPFSITGSDNWYFLSCSYSEGCSTACPKLPPRKYEPAEVSITSTTTGWSERLSAKMNDSFHTAAMIQRVHTNTQSVALCARTPTWAGAIELVRVPLL